jgi:protein-tyrosine phosphatase
VIDLHSHVLFGIDDGATTLEYGVAMARMAAAAGTADIVATPHSGGVEALPAGELESRLEALRRECGDAIQIHSGVEWQLTYRNFVHLVASPLVNSINGKGYLLVELPESLPGPSSEQMLGELLEAGLRIVVAHPERNAGLAEEFRRLARLVERGAFLQVTAMSLTGEFGGAARKCGEWLLERGLAHFVASDGHDLVKRPPRLDLANNDVIRMYGEEYATALFEANPRAVIEGTPLQAGPMAAPPRRRKWFDWGK